MSTDKRPGMAVNEEKIAKCVSETREQAKRAHYPRRPVPLHGKVETKPRQEGKPVRRDEG